MSRGWSNSSKSLEQNPSHWRNNQTAPSKDMPGSRSLGWNLYGFKSWPKFLVDPKIGFRSRFYYLLESKWVLNMILLRLEMLENQGEPKTLFCDGKLKTCLSSGTHRFFFFFKERHSCASIPFHRVRDIYMGFPLCTWTIFFCIWLYMTFLLLHINIFNYVSVFHLMVKEWCIGISSFFKFILSGNILEIELWRIL